MASISFHEMCILFWEDSKILIDGLFTPKQISHTTIKMSNSNLSIFAEELSYDKFCQQNHFLIIIIQNILQ